MVQKKIISLKTMLPAFHQKQGKSIDQKKIRDILKTEEPKHQPKKAGKKAGKNMLEYKIDIIEKLQEAGVNTTVAKKTGVFGQSTMKKFRDGDTNISLDILNKLCCILEMQPRDIVKYVETENDRNNILSKICNNLLTFSKKGDNLKK